MTKAVGFYVKAGHKTGYGHIVRCVALADELAQQGAKCLFITNRDGMERVKRQGVHSVHSATLIDNVDIHRDAWVLDLEGGIPPRLAADFKPLCDKLIILNGVGYPDGDPGRLVADLVFYQGVTDRPQTLDWTGFNGSWFVGPEYLILRDEFRALPQHEPHDKPRVVITGGGSDPFNVTAKAVDALQESSLDLRVIVGPANDYDNSNAEIIKDPSSMAQALAWADVAVISYGMTAFECLALGIPTVALSISPGHKASADLVQIQSSGALVSLGEVNQVTPRQIKTAMWSQLSRQATLSRQARTFVDARGAERVARMILE